MILCADSGSTKTQWLSEQNELIETSGINPQFHTTQSIFNVLQKSEALNAIKEKISQVFFYGAGCSSIARNTVVANALSQFFTHAKILVEHDLKAAVYATYSGVPCISCIIGTGSNACFFDGKDIYQNTPSLGYILGDEGSGSWFGRALLKQYLYGLLPEKTHQLLRDKYQVEKEKVFHKIYQEPHANVYLASFAKVLSESEDKVFVNGLVNQGFASFFRYHILSYPNYKEVPVNFVGSLAFHFKNELEKVAQSFGATLGNINKAPIHHLLKFHLKDMQAG